MKKIMMILLTPMYCFATNVSDYINKNNCNQIVDKRIYKSCYDYSLKGAKYVAYTIDSKKIKAGDKIKKRPSFYVEKKIPKKYRSFPSDYTHTGYDRGHMANHADFNYSYPVLYQTYSMANIVPQAAKVNRKAWLKAERYERQVAYKLGTVNVINGIKYAKEPKRIGRHQVAVPENFWKMIYNDDKKFQRCFIYNNDKDINLKKDKLKNHVIDCAKLK